MKEKVVDRVGIGGVEYRFFRIISNTRSVWDDRVFGYLDAWKCFILFDDFEW